MTKRLYISGFILICGAMICGAATGVFLFLIQDLPQIRSLETYEPPAITRIYSADHKLLAELYREKRDPVQLEKMPRYLKQAIITAEDRQFYDHGGIDLKGILRAIIHDIRAGGFVQGASTITQQLSKTLFLSPEKTLIRKIKEALLAIQLERRYTKDEILSLYLNQIYLGSGAYGVEAAAQKFFSTPVSDLNLAQCAMIAAMPKAPSAYSPLVNPERAVQRRNIVLRQMRDCGIITPVQHDDAAATPYTPVQRDNRSPAPYFVDHIKQVLETELGPRQLYTGGLTIFTTLSAELQAAADQAITQGITALLKRREKNPALTTPPQGALVAIDVKTGGILAMTGGTDYRTSRFNRAAAASRQPGSAFKPVVYAYAIEQGFHQASLLLDAPVSFPGASKDQAWMPENFSRTCQGEITLRTALAHSKNIPAVRLLNQTGISNVIGFARKLGIQSPLAPYLSLALGSSGVTLLELTAAYAVFANQGIYIQPHGILAVLDADNQNIWQPVPEKHIAMTREGAAVVCNLLEAVVAEGTGKRAQAVSHPVAGKTGTTNDCKDALFVGFSPSIAAGVWVGCDDYTSLGNLETGARAALPAWTAFMKKALENKPYEYFDVPENTLFRSIHPETGAPADGAPGAVTALFRKTALPAAAP